jgi:hypothetical protein
MRKYQQVNSDYGCAPIYIGNSQHKEEWDNLDPTTKKFVYDNLEETTKKLSFDMAISTICLVINDLAKKIQELEKTIKEKDLG